MDEERRDTPGGEWGESILPALLSASPRDTVEDLVDT